MRELVLAMPTNSSTRAVHYYITTHYNRTTTITTTASAGNGVWTLHEY